MKPIDTHTYYGTHNIPASTITYAAHHDALDETISSAVAAAIRNLYTTAHQGNETLDATTIHITIQYRNGSDDLQITSTANTPARREPA